MIRPVDGSRKDSWVGCHPGAVAALSPWRRRPSHPTTATTTRAARISRPNTAPTSAGADDDRGAVRHDLGQALPDLRRIEAHADDGVGAHDAGVLDHAVHSVAPAVFQQFGVLSDP